MVKDRLMAFVTLVSLILSGVVIAVVAYGFVMPVSTAVLPTLAVLPNADVAVAIASTDKSPTSFSTTATVNPQAAPNEILEPQQSFDDLSVVVPPYETPTMATEIAEIQPTHIMTATASSTAPVTNEPSTVDGEIAVPDQVVVNYESAEKLQDYMDQFGDHATIVQDMPAIQAVVIQFDEIVDPDLLPMPDGIYVEPNYYMQATADSLTSDPRITEQWALGAIQVNYGWAHISDETPTVTVVVIDSGVCLNHEDLVGRILPGKDFIDDDDDPQDEFGHGCAVTGIIAANINNEVGIAGVATHTKIFPLRVLDESGVGTYSDLAESILYAVEKQDPDITIINLSLGGVYPSQLLENAVSFAADNGVEIVAAAGNTSSEQQLYPAAYPSVISVGSINAQFNLSDFSSRNYDYLAPGENILTTDLNGYQYVSGTSFAAPYFSGILSTKYATGATLHIENKIVQFASDADDSFVNTNTATPSATSIVTNETYLDLIEKVRQQGRLLVIVGLNVNVQMEANLSPQSVDIQRQQIATAQERLISNLSAYTIEVGTRFEVIPYIALEVDEASLNWLIQSASVTSIIENEVMSPLLLDSNTQIGSPVVWANGYTGSGQTIAILDTGFDTTHPFISNKIVEQACFSQSDGLDLVGLPTCANQSPMQIGLNAAHIGECSSFNGASYFDCIHGTHVAGIAAGYSPEEAFSGVAPDAQLITINIATRYENETICSNLLNRPAPCLGIRTTDQIKALQYILSLQEQYQIAAVNLSFGAGIYNGVCDSQQSIYFDIVQQLAASDIAVVAAAGNDGVLDALNSPACLSNVVSVGAVTEIDDVVATSNVASFLDYLAPGQDVTSSIPPVQPNLYGYLSLDGTSMAAPHITGAFAIMRQAAPDLSLPQIRSILSTSGVLIPVSSNSTPNLNIPRIQLDNAIESLATITVTIKGTIWADQNSDGIRQPSEQGLEGIEVQLIDAAQGDVVASQPTQDLGEYIFTSLPEGEYYIKVIPDNGYWFTRPNRGSDLDLRLGESPSMTLLLGEQVVFDGGLFQPTFHVTREDDPAPEFCYLDSCSLREAIITANLMLGFNEIYLPPGHYQLEIKPEGDEAIIGTSNAESSLSELSMDILPQQKVSKLSELDEMHGDFDIVDNLAIIGSGANVTIIDGDYQDRVFHISDAISEDATITVEIQGVTITKGIGGAANPCFERRSCGGGILNDGGNLTLLETRLVANKGISRGGAIYNFDGDVKLIQSEVSANSATVLGGGIYSYYGNFLIANSTISSNIIESGPDGVGASGLLSFEESKIKIVNSTFWGNNFQHLLQGGDSEIDIQNSILSNSLEGGNCRIEYRKRFHSLGNNISDDDTCQLGNYDVEIDYPILHENLALNNGMTYTHALLPDTEEGKNFAINGGNDDICQSLDVGGVDQRGISRTDDNFPCDIGAYEMPLHSLSIANESNPMPEDLWEVTITSQRIEEAHTLGNSGSRDLEHLVPGPYSIRIDLPEDWEFSNITCSVEHHVIVDSSSAFIEMFLPMDDDVECDFSSEYRPPVTCSPPIDPLVALTASDIDITYNAGTGMFTATTTVSNTSSCEYEVGMAAYHKTHSSWLAEWLGNQELVSWTPNDIIPATYTGQFDGNIRVRDDEFAHIVPPAIGDVPGVLELSISFEACKTQIDVVFDASQQIEHRFSVSDASELDKVPLIIPEFNGNNLDWGGWRGNTYSSTHRLLYAYHLDQHYIEGEGWWDLPVLPDCEGSQDETVPVLQLTPTGDVIGFAGQSVSVNLEDVDGDPLTCIIEGLPTSITQIGDTCAIEGTLTSNGSLTEIWDVSITAINTLDGTEANASFMIVILLPISIPPSPVGTQIPLSLPELAINGEVVSYRIASNPTGFVYADDILTLPDTPGTYQLFITINNKTETLIEVEVTDSSILSGESNAETSTEETLVEEEALVENAIVTSFMLVDADADIEMAQLTDGMVIDVSATVPFTIVAKTNEAEIGSVVFELLGPSGRFIKTENDAPYALYGNNAEDFYPADWLAGTYILIATPYSQVDGQGETGKSLTINFTVIDSEPTVEEQPPVVEVEESTPVIDTSPVIEETPIADEETPMVEDEPVIDETSLPEETPEVEEIPVVEETPEAKETPLAAETPATEDEPTVEATVTEDSPATEEPTEVEEVPVSEE